MIASSRIILHSRNRGISVTRGTALAAAHGEYIIFADPDDWVDEGFYSSLYATAKECDADFIWEDFWLDVDGWASRVIQGSKCSNAHVLCADILRGSLHGATWNKLIRRSYLLEHGIEFLAKRVSLCEDLCFLCEILMTAPRIAYQNGCHYHYCVRSQSATQCLSSDSFASLDIVGRRLDGICTTLDTHRALYHWKQGVRLSAAFSDNVTWGMFRNLFPEVDNLRGLKTNLVLKVMFWIAVRGGRSCMLTVYRLIRRRGKRRC